MSFLLGSLITEVGAVITEAGLELGLGESASGFIGGVAAITLKDKIDNYVDEQLRSSLGEDTAEKVEAVKNDAFSLFGSIMSGNPQEYAYRKVEEKRKEAEERNLPVAEEIIPQDTQNKNVCKCEKQEDDFIDSGDIKLNDGVKEKVNAFIKGADVGSLIAEHAKELALNGISDHLNGILGTNIDLSNSETVKKTQKEILNDLVKTEGKYDYKKLTMVQKLSTYYADRKLFENNPKFLEIFRTYTGEGLSPENVIISEDEKNWYFQLYDELGELITLTQDKNAFTLPPAYGCFGGPLSPNRPNYPTNTRTVPQDYPDTCFLCHDYQYSLPNSYFTWEYDMVLCARLVNGRNKWPIDSTTQLNAIIIYFATIGASIAGIKETILGKNPDVEKNIRKKDDFFEIFVPEAVSLEPEDYQEQKDEFYKSFDEGIETAIEVYSPLGINTPQQQLKKINDIQIEIL